VGVFFTGRDWETGNEGTMDGAKYRELLRGNLLYLSRDLRLGQWFTFQ